MTPDRLFVGWSSSCVDAVVDLLWGQCSGGSLRDLSAHIVVTSSARAGRRLVELLAIRARRDGGADRVTLLPPRVCTIGRIPEELYLPDLPIAGELASLLAWVTALKDADAATLEPLIGKLPDGADMTTLLAIARDLAAQRAQVTGEGITLAKVASACGTVAGFDDSARWKALAALEDRYLDALQTAGRADRDQAREAIAAGTGGEWIPEETGKQIWLVGVLEMPALVKRVLAAFPGRVSSVVVAPECRAQQFDEYGCVIPSQWADATVGLDSDNVIIAESPQDQASAVVAALAALNGECSAGQIVVGIGDESAHPAVERALDAAQIASRSSLGRAVDRSGPAQLLRAVGAFVNGKKPAAAAALLRHPDVEGVIWRAGSAISQFDRYITEHVPAVISTDLPERIGQEIETRHRSEAAATTVSAGNDDGDDVVVEIEEEGEGKKTPRYLGSIPRVCKSLVALAERFAGKRRLSAWVEPLLKLLDQCYGGKQSLDSNNPNDRLLIRAAESIAEAVKDLQSLPAGLDREVTAPEAIGLVLSSVRSLRVPEYEEGPVVDLVGWLELHLDDCPVKVVVGLNEGIIPSGSRVDPVLPDVLRQALDLPDTRSQYARDVCVLATLAGAGTPLMLIAGKTSAEGEPLTPSRLLFQGMPDAEVAKRAVSFFGSPARQWRPAPVRLDGGEPEQAQGEAAPVLIPYPVTSGSVVNARGETVALPLKELRVTGFRDYIADPYRFYLKHVLGLRTEEDTAVELQANTFGNVAHRVLAAFGRSDARDCEDPKLVEAALERLLEEDAKLQFGCTRSIALTIQLDRLRRRLGAFAKVQAAEAASGWRIDKVEHEIEHDLRLDDGSTFRVIGRIDRIDVKRDGAGQVTEVRVIDYKTGDKAKTPEQVHREGRDGSKVWTDLQLPLYQLWARGEYEVGADNVAMAYMLLPAKSADVGLALAQWTMSDTDEAFTTAQEVARGVREGVYWPPKAPPGFKPFEDGLEGITLERASGWDHLCEQSGAATGPVVVAQPNPAGGSN